MGVKNIVLKGLWVALISFPLITSAQSMREVKPLSSDEPVVIIDYGDKINHHTRIPFDRNITSGTTSGRINELNAAVFEVTYVGFTANQRTAFQYAVDIWSTLLTSDIPIRIRASMESLGSNVLGQTSVPNFQANFNNAQKINTFYPVSLAEKISGEHLNDPDDYDIVMQFSTDFPWYFGLDAQTPSDKFDFVSVILHEIAHGLGFIDGTNVSGNLGYYAPFSYDRYIENQFGNNLIANYESGTEQLASQLTGEQLYFRSFSFPLTINRPRLYAPSSWDPGSSISHLDEATYPPGNPNSLMSPSFGYSEAIHDPGLALEMFEDMGWLSMRIDFDRFLDSEDSISDRTITAVISGDFNVRPEEIELHYTYSDFANEVIVTMTSTGTPNEYSGVIPATGSEEEVKYYIDINTDAGRKFSSPGEAPDYFWDFSMARDLTLPEILHDSISLVFLDKSIIPVEVTVSDNLGISDLKMVYRVNGGVDQSFSLPATEVETDGWYVATHNFNWDISNLGLAKGDIIEYRIEATDASSAANGTVYPEEGYFVIETEKLNEPVDIYENDFNAATEDFIGTGFVISLEDGFDSEAIHSNHPYKTVDGQFPDDTLVHTFMLKTPIILSDKDASLIFDEVVLVEPGGPGTEYGDQDMWDYVIVEGAKDLDGPWVPLAPGYDSRENEVWLDAWQSGELFNGNSNTTGDLSMFVNTEIDMTSNTYFSGGDTILVRFKLYSDQLAHGWGWAIDNIKIQKDEKPPVVTQITPDYLLPGDTELLLSSRVVDNLALDSVVYELDFNGQTQVLSLPGTSNLFNINLSFSPGITETDVFKYRIIAVDKAPVPNTIIVPATGFFEVPVAEFGTPISMYVNDFNSPSDDFIGQSFEIIQPENFFDPGIRTINPYPLSPFETSEITYTLKYPIILGPSRAMVTYDEIVLVEPDVEMVSFEVSKDNGQTWIPALDPYSSTAQNFWKNAFNFGLDSDGTSATLGATYHIRNRIFNILDNPELSAGEEVLVRFKLSVNDNINGWGWFIDNLEIQSPTTAIEEDELSLFEVYPNPSNTGVIEIKGQIFGPEYSIRITDLQGKVMHEKEFQASGNEFHGIFHLNHLKKGVYLVSLISERGVSTKRVIFE